MKNWSFVIIDVDNYWFEFDIIEFVELVQMLYFLFELHTAILVILDYFFNFEFFARVKIFSHYLIFHLMARVFQFILPIFVGVEVSLYSLQLFQGNPWSIVILFFMLKAICIYYWLDLEELLFITIFVCSWSKYQDLVRE